MEACPVVGTTNHVLPPSHPDIDLSQDNLVCPVVGASTTHHHNLSKHPSVSIPANEKPGNAAACPALREVVKEEKSLSMDDMVCPVVGTVTSVLPPEHPDVKGKEEGEVCPVTKASVGHHLGKVVGHPSVEGSEKGAVCPVTGAKAS